MPDWNVAGLPAFASWDEQQQSNIVAFSPELGRDITRRRGTAAIAKVTATLVPVTSAEWIRVRTFFKNDCASGVNTFTILHPLTGESVTVAFDGKEPPKVSGNQSSPLLSVSMTLQVIP